MNPADSPQPQTPLRTTLASVSALIVFGLMLGIAFQVAQPAASGPGRDASAERSAIRELSGHVVRVGRERDGSDQHKPAISCRPKLSEREATSRAMAPVATPEAGSSLLVRVERHNLPPPSMRVAA